MRYEKGHKETTHRKIVATASAEFRKHGFDGVGIADVMAKAGLTPGGFYSHFDSKESLIREALDYAFRNSRITEAASAGMGLKEIVRKYLATSRRDCAHGGCAVATLSGEIARRAPQTRRAFAACTSKLVSEIEASLPAKRVRSPRVQRRTALAITALLAGTVQMARVEPDSNLSRHILEAGTEAAFTLAKTTR